MGAVWNKRRRGACRRHGGTVPRRRAVRTPRDHALRARRAWGRPPALRAVRAPCAMWGFQDSAAGASSEWRDSFRSLCGRQSWGTLCLPGGGAPGRVRRPADAPCQAAPPRFFAAPTPRGTAAIARTGALHYLWANPTGERGGQGIMKRPRRRRFRRGRLLCGAGAGAPGRASHPGPEGSSPSRSTTERSTEGPIGPWVSPAARAPGSLATACLQEIESGGHTGNWTGRRPGRRGAMIRCLTGGDAPWERGVRARAGGIPPVLFATAHLEAAEELTPGRARRRFSGGGGGSGRGTAPTEKTRSACVSARCWRSGARAPAEHALSFVRISRLGRSRSAKTGSTCRGLLGRKHAMQVYYVRSCPRKWCCCAPSLSFPSRQPAAAPPCLT